MRKTYLPLSDEDRDYLKALSKKRTIQAQVVDRARILLYKAECFRTTCPAAGLYRYPKHLQGSREALCLEWNTLE